MSLAGSEIYVSMRNVKFQQWQEIGGEVKYYTGPYIATLQMNIHGYITHPKGPAWCKDTGIIEHGYRKFTLERDYVIPPSNPIVYVLWVEESKYQELNNRRQQKWIKESK